MAKYLVLLILFGTSLRAEDCCKNDRNLLIKNKCAPNATGGIPALPLKCHEKYILNSHVFEDDNYTVTVNGSLYVFGHGDRVLIPPDE